MVLWVSALPEAAAITAARGRAAAAAAVAPAPGAVDVVTGSGGSSFGEGGQLLRGSERPTRGRAGRAGRFPCEGEGGVRAGGGGGPFSAVLTAIPRAGGGSRGTVPPPLPPVPRGALAPCRPPACRSAPAAGGPPREPSSPPAQVRQRTALPGSSGAGGEVGLEAADPFAYGLKREVAESDI